MTAHKHVDMITAKANNTELVVFVRNKIDGSSTTLMKWCKLFGDMLPSFEGDEYFLCLPQHQEAVLHVLNGGIIHITTDSHWNNPSTLDRIGKWQNYSDAWYMSPYCQSRIKPKKEKRWVVYRHDGEIIGPFDSYKFAEGINSGQVIEIEVEHGG